MSQIGAEYEIVVTDVNGDVVANVSAESDSFVLNFVKLLESGMRNANVSVVDLNGITRACGNFTCTVATDSTGVTTRHILVGSGISPVAYGDYALAEQIPGSVLFHNPSLVRPESPHIVDGFIKSRIARRSFSNVSADSVTIAEIGIAVLASSYNVLILRDVLQAPVVVPASGAVDISYVFKTEV